MQAALDALAREVEATPRLVLARRPSSLERLQAALDETAEAVGFAGQIVGPGRRRPARAAAFVLDWGDGRRPSIPTGRRRPRRRGPAKRRSPPKACTPNP